MIPFPNIDPEIFSIDLFGFHLALRWYALAYIVGILLAWRIMFVTTSRAPLWPNATPPIAPKAVEDLITYAILGIILGGRLGYVVFYQPGYYIANPAEILQVWNGGMSFHGGFLGVVIAAYLFLRKYDAPILTGADMIAIASPVGLLLGRLANFINAELWGRETDAPWGVVFPGDAAQACGQITGICARHPSQLYEAALEGLVLGVLLLYLVYRRGGLRYPGLMTGVFLTGYGLARGCVEFFRQPDAQFYSFDNPMGYALQFGGWGGLTMGQILSLPMIVFGVVLILRARHKGAM